MHKVVIFLHLQKFKIRWNIQDQVGWGSEQPDPVEDVPAYCRGFGLSGL